MTFLATPAPPTSVYSTNFVHFESHQGYSFWCRKEESGVTVEEAVLVGRGVMLPSAAVERIGQTLLFSAQHLMMRAAAGRA
jgi:hypothetical protein